jgi:hypothetical protein
MSNSIFSRRTFAPSHKKALDLFRSLSGVAVDDQNIMIRVNTSNLSADSTNFPVQLDDMDTFVVTTSADSENLITYESVFNTVNLNVRDGGYF